MSYNLALPDNADKQEAELWLRRLCNAFGLGFHLDTPAKDYVDENGNGLTDDECRDLDDSVKRLFELLPDPYTVAVDEMERMMRKGMDETQANVVAEALGGEAWNSGGGIWLVCFRRTDGRLVVLSDDAVCEYADDNAFEANEAEQSIVLR